MAAESFLEIDFKRRIAKLELIFSSEFIIQLTNIINKESEIDDNPDSISYLENEEYCNCISELYDLIMKYCEKNNITTTDYIHNGEKIPNSIVFFLNNLIKTQLIII